MKDTAHAHGAPGWRPGTRRMAKSDDGTGGLSFSCWVNVYVAFRCLLHSPNWESSHCYINKQTLQRDSKQIHIRQWTSRAVCCSFRFCSLALRHVRPQPRPLLCRPAPLGAPDSPHRHQEQ
ncbi:uncharacterized protein [Drosophila kikkawai]|uniref:Uncharacterized protein n=1 Tax=Drosophila kikkawai TaxID=30033 RepID=A0ABM4GLM7_DROKI